MPLEQSPNLNDFDFAPAPEEKKHPTSNSKKKIRVLSAGLAILVLTLALGNFLQNDINAPLQGNGTVRGVVLDEKGQPIQNGYVVVLGTPIRADIAADGSFELKKIPAGTGSLVVLDRYTGQEIPFVITNNETLNLGTIQFKTTSEPEF